MLFSETLKPSKLQAHGLNSKRVKFNLSQPFLFIVINWNNQSFNKALLKVLL